MASASDNSHIISVGSLSVHYWESNPTAEHTLVMLHGFRSSHEGLMKLAKGFPDHHLIIPDFPGYGQTDELAGQHTVETYAEFIGDFITQLELRQFTLMGHSFGAVVGLAYAAGHPEGVANLVLISPVPKPNLASRALTLYYLIGRTLPAPLDRRWLTNRALHRPVRQMVVRTHDPVLLAEVMSEGERELEALRPHINVQNYLSFANIDPTGWLKRAKVPILVVAGDADRLTHLADIQHSYVSPRVTFKIIEGMGHFAPAEIPTEISRTVVDWLDTLDSNVSPRRPVPAS